jgi:hypothetical protein
MLDDYDYEYGHEYEIMNSFMIMIVMTTMIKMPKG